MGVAIGAKNEMRREILYYVLIICVFTCSHCALHETQTDPSSPIVLHSASRPTQESESVASAWDGSSDLEPGLNGNDILFFADFEAADYKDGWPVYWGQPVGAGTVSSPDKYVFAGNKSAYLEARKGSHESLGAGEYFPAQPIDDVVYMRVYLRLEDGFSMGTSQSLKLFTIRGGVDPEHAYGGAGAKPTGADKLEVTLAIDNWRALELYYYHADQQSGYGDLVYCGGFFSTPKLSPGRWYCLELMVKANTPGHKDGQIRAWMDGRLIGDVDRLRFRDTDALKIRRFGVSAYFGGALASDTSSKDQRVYIDNLVVSRKPIACLGVGQ